jgi:hypothetical protein
LAKALAQAGPFTNNRTALTVIHPWKTKNQASFGGSILKANMEMEVELAHDLDATGMHSVRLHRVGLLDFC